MFLLILKKPATVFKPTDFMIEYCGGAMFKVMTKKRFLGLFPYWVQLTETSFDGTESLVSFKTKEEAEEYLHSLSILYFEMKNMEGVLEKTESDPTVDREFNVNVYNKAKERWQKQFDHVKELIAK
jgi:hypothetical protein